MLALINPIHQEDNRWKPIITEHERPKRFDRFLEPLPVVPQDVLRRRAENRTKGRTLRLIEQHGLEAVRRQYRLDVQTVAAEVDVTVTKMANWDADILLDMRRWINGRTDAIQHRMRELVVAAEVIKRHQDEECESL